MLDSKQARNIIEKEKESAVANNKNSGKSAEWTAGFLQGLSHAILAITLAEQAHTEGFEAFIRNRVECTTCRWRKYRKCTKKGLSLRPYKKRTPEWCPIRLDNAQKGQEVGTVIDSPEAAERLIRAMEQAEQAQPGQMEVDNGAESGY